MNKIFNITAEELEIILYQYYPTVSHKTATRIIRDIEIASERKEKKEND